MNRKSIACLVSALFGLSLAFAAGSDPDYDASKGDGLDTYLNFFLETKVDRQSCAERYKQDGKRMMDLKTGRPITFTEARLLNEELNERRGPLHRKISDYVEAGSVDLAAAEALRDMVNAGALDVASGALDALTAAPSHPTPPPLQWDKADPDREKMPKGWEQKVLDEAQKSFARPLVEGLRPQVEYLAKHPLRFEWSEPEGFKGVGYVDHDRLILDQEAAREGWVYLYYQGVPIKDIPKRLAFKMVPSIAAIVRGQMMDERVRQAGAPFEFSSSDSRRLIWFERVKISVELQQSPLYAKPYALDWIGYYDQGDMNARDDWERNPVLELDSGDSFQDQTLKSLTETLKGSESQLTAALADPKASKAFTAKTGMGPKYQVWALDAARTSLKTLSRPENYATLRRMYLEENGKIYKEWDSERWKKWREARKKELLDVRKSALPPCARAQAR
jgi:hypothetical protein